AMMMMPITQSHRQVNPSRGVVAISVITVGITRDLAFCYLAYLELWILIHVRLLIRLQDEKSQAYISGTSNECDNNLSSEQDGDFTEFQKVDVESNVQLTPTFIIKENKRSYS
ncbi:hypothetical protein CFP56_041794, partial [Quercus suber]